jgi:hypothetical protein
MNDDLMTRGKEADALARKVGPVGTPWTNLERWDLCHEDANV